MSDGPEPVDQASALNRWAQDVTHVLPPPTAEKPPPPPEAPKVLPSIKLPGEGRQVTAFARECAQAFNTGDTVFRKDGVPVWIDPETGAIERLDEFAFGTELERVAVTIIEKKVMVDDEEVTVKRQKTTAPTAAKMVLRSREFIFALRKLERVNMICQPIQREDGSMELLRVGYDEASGIYTMPNNIKIDGRFLVRRADGTADASEAACVVRNFLGEFPMVSELDLAVQVCSMVSFYGALLVPSNAARLGWLLKANKHGSGKTLLAKITVIPVMGRAIVLPFPKDESELKKTLDSFAIGGNVYVIFDDISGHLKSGELNAFMTAAHWGGRKMHTQTQFEAKRQAVVFLSGHEVTPSPDIARRVLECRLHVTEADATKHQVKTPVDDEYLSRPSVRSDLCSALWAMILAWHEAGRPRIFNKADQATKATVRPGFESWCAFFGPILMHAGFEDPLGRRPDDEGTDPEFADWQKLMESLAAEFGPGDKMKEFVFSDLIERCMTLSAFSWAIQGSWKSDKDTKERWFEASDKTNGIMGRMFSEKYNNTKVDLPDGRRLQFGHKGKNRHKKFQVVIIPRT